MTWNIGIPSWRRPNTIKSLRTLAEGGVSRERINLFVARQELEDYQSAVDPGLVNQIVPHDSPGILSGAHNAIIDTLGPGQVVHMDDDIAELSEKVDVQKLDRVTDISAIIDNGFSLAEKYRATLWGIYPVHNAYFMRHIVITKCAFVPGGLFGQIISGRSREYNTLDISDDYERSLNHFMMDGVVVRMNWIAAHTKVYAGGGGLQDCRTPERVLAAVVALEARFPGMVRRTKVRGGFQEIAIREPKGTS